ncbi:toxin Cry1Ac domain D-VI-related protein [Listeria cornellensis]|uniref:toxin Cry1Ac domain D-VI-related protein n=1 Tax=Listeria cornellensis TaxID=1494961 RepID=UPI0004B0E1F8|nr:toxin Cry1Ac domain D-VI-related protein [Listeria cornellensis]
MKNKQIKKMVSVLTVASILGTSIVTPLSVFASPALAAEGTQTVSAPTYPVGGNEFVNFSGNLSAQNAFFQQVDITNDLLYIDMTLVYKGYGIEVTMPDGEIIKYYKKAEKGILEYYTLDLKGRAAGTVRLKTLNPNGTYERAAVATVQLVATGNTGLSLSNYGTAVYGLFSDSTFTALAANVTQSDIDAAKALAASVPASAEKTRLTELADKAQKLLNDSIAKENDARNAVNALFNNNTPSTNVIKETTDQAAIDNAQKLINEVADVAKKAEMQSDLNKAKELLVARIALEQEATAKQLADQTVKGLFENNDPTSDKIKTTTDQSAINAAQETVNAVKDPVAKEALQKEVDRAKELLKERSEAAAADKTQQALATFLVKQLFENNTPTTDAIKSVVGQEEINNAQVEVDRIQDPAIKAVLQKDLDRAQTLLNERNESELTAAEQARQTAATKAVKELFSNDNPATDTIKTTTTQKSDR